MPSCTQDFSSRTSVASTSMLETAPVYSVENCWSLERGGGPLRYPYDQGIK